MTKRDEMTLIPQADSHARAGQACLFESSPVSGGAGASTAIVPLIRFHTASSASCSHVSCLFVKSALGSTALSTLPKVSFLHQRWGSGGKGLAPGKATLFAFPACPAWNGEEPQRKTTPGFLTRRSRKRKGLEHLFPSRNMSISYCARYETHGENANADGPSTICRTPVDVCSSR